MVIGKMKEKQFPVKLNDKFLLEGWYWLYIVRGFSDKEADLNLRNFSAFFWYQLTVR